MAKKFMYVCFGLLALAVAFHLGARYGSADTIVDHGASGAVSFTSPSPMAVLLDTGEVWFWNSTIGWNQTPVINLPVPVSSIKFWDCYQFLTFSGELWEWRASSWMNHGAPPGLVSTRSTTWSHIKAEFGEPLKCLKARMSRLAGASIILPQPDPLKSRFL